MKFKFPTFGATPLSVLIPSASPEAIQLISDMLKYDPSKRPSAMQALQYPFFMVGMQVPRPPASVGADIEAERPSSLEAGQRTLGPRKHPVVKAAVEGEGAMDIGSRMGLSAPMAMAAGAGMGSAATSHKVPGYAGMGGGTGAREPALDAPHLAQARYGPGQGSNGGGPLSGGGYGQTAGTYGRPAVGPGYAQGLGSMPGPAGHAQPGAGSYAPGYGQGSGAGYGQYGSSCSPASGASRAPPPNPAGGAAYGMGAGPPALSGGGRGLAPGALPTSNYDTSATGRTAADAPLGSWSSAACARGGAPAPVPGAKAAGSLAISSASSGSGGAYSSLQSHAPGPRPQAVPTAAGAAQGSYASYGQGTSSTSCAPPLGYAPLQGGNRAHGECGGQPPAVPVAALGSARGPAGSNSARARAPPGAATNFLANRYAHAAVLAGGGAILLALLGVACGTGAVPSSFPFRCPHAPCSPAVNGAHAMLLQGRLHAPRLWAASRRAQRNTPWPQPA